MDKDIIQNMYHYHDSQIDKYFKYFEGDIKIKTRISTNDLEFSIMEFYKNGKKISTASYSILGKYNIKDNIWEWGWSLPITKNQNFFVKKIFDYGYNIVDNNTTTKLIKDLLINSIIHIKNLDFLLSLSLYITKNEYIHKDNDNKYYLLKDIEIY